MSEQKKLLLIQIMKHLLKKNQKELEKYNVVIKFSQRKEEDNYLKKKKKQKDVKNLQKKKEEIKKENEQCNNKFGI